MHSWFVPRYHHLFAREDFPLRSDPELRVRCAGNLLTADEILAQPGAETLSVHQPAVQAGDLIVWNNLLPHGSGRNTSDAPRIGNNIGLTPLTVHENLFRTRMGEIEGRPGVRKSEFSPTEVEIETERAWRIERWRDRNGDKGMSGERCRELIQPEPARLTALGAKLLGLDPW